MSRTLNANTASILFLVTVDVDVEAPTLIRVKNPDKIADPEIFFLLGGKVFHVIFSHHSRNKTNLHHRSLSQSAFKVGRPRSNRVKVLDPLKTESINDTRDSSESNLDPRTKRGRFPDLMATKERDDASIFTLPNASWN